MSLNNYKMKAAVQGAVFRELLVKADVAGREAAARCVPDPMVVVSGDRKYFVADGACGFAYVKVSPANSAFGRYVKKIGLFRPAYQGGLEMSVSQYNQSVQLKEAYAYAYAEVLRSGGVNAFAYSRLD